MTKITRCSWCDSEKIYRDYHDNEWGIPVFDDQKLFEFLILEGAQAGLSWITILKKREGYRQAFADFDVDKASKLEDDQLEKILLDPGIVRNRLKVFSVRTNAQAFIQVQKEHGSFSHYIWSFVDHQAIQNRWRSINELPASNDTSKLISNDLKKRGFKFVGPTIIYAYMQAIGMVNDHQIDCFRYNQLK